MYNNYHILYRTTTRATSYVHGSTARPLLGATIGQLLERRAEMHPDKEAVVFCQQRVTLNFEQQLQQVFDIVNEFV